MKTLLSFLLLILLYACIPAEKSIPRDPDVVHYILNCGYYIPMNNEAAMKKILEESTDKIVDFMDNNGMNRENYYLVDGAFAVSADADYIMVPIRHYSSIERDFIAGKNAAELGKKQLLDKQGNPHGTDGYLLLHIRKDEVEGFQPWK